MGREYELKFAATAQSLAQIASDHTGFQTIRMETTYFDTAERSLSRMHVTLRLRKENDLQVCTVKTPLSNGSRGEWDCVATDITDGIRQLSDQVPAELLPLLRQELEPVCGARFTRMAKTLVFPEGELELALDEGVLLGGGRELPLTEVEAELKSGPDGLVKDFADTLAHRYGLTAQPDSKFRRAMALAEGE